jgi:hypothetical protein
MVVVTIVLGANGITKEPFNAVNKTIESATTE